MSVIVEFTLPSEEFLLEESLSAAPDAVVEIERVVAHADGRVTPYLWVSGGDRDDFEAALRDDPSVVDVERVDVLDDAALYRAVWNDRGDGLVDAYRTIDMVILEAAGRAGRWQLRVRFDDRQELDAFNAYRREHGLSATVERIYHLHEPHGGGEYGLTPTQRDTLVTALDVGYYDVPRGATHAELAERLGVSQQAVSDRLHRAHGNLVRNALTVSELDLGSRQTI